MQINAFFEGVDSYEGYQSAIINEIDSKIELGKCVITTKTHDDKEKYNEQKCRLINYDICERNQYEKICDMDQLIPLSKDVLEGMRPYESVAIQMLIRNFERDVYTFDEAKERYLKHLRFWNHIIVSENINFICLNNIPHHTHDYVIYALGKVYGIPMCLCADTSIQPRLSIGDDLTKLWEPLQEPYGKYRKLECVELPEDIENYYQSVQYDGEKRNDSVVHRGMSRKEHIAIRRKNFTQYFELKAVVKRNGSLIKQGIKLSIAQKKMEPLKERLEQVRINRAFQKRAKLKLRSMRGVKYYNKLTTEPVEGEKYVIYFLHLQPEATTLPQGGVFSEQELMIQMLSYVLGKYDIKLYVKEHFVQPYRNKTFYDKLAKMNNVKLIHCDVDSKQLAKNAVATASCNGTILLESIVNGKPSFVFGYTAFQKAPGIYNVGSADECKQALDEILAGVCEISQKDVRAYLKAFGDCSIRTYFDVRKYDKDSSLTPEEGRKAYTEYIIDRIQAICTE